MFLLSVSAINAKGKVIPPRKEYGSFLSQCTLKHSNKQIPNTQKKPMELTEEEKFF